MVRRCKLTGSRATAGRPSQAADISHLDKNLSLSLSLPPPKTQKAGFPSSRSSRRLQLRQPCASAPPDRLLGHSRPCGLPSQASPAPPAETDLETPAVLGYPTVQGSWQIHGGLPGREWSNGNRLFADVNDFGGGGEDSSRPRVKS
jgi:hypothetical protein